MKFKRMFSLLLVLAMVIMILPMTMLSAFAADGGETTTTEKNITLGVSHIKGAQASNVYFGTYQQSSDGNVGYNIDPIKWRVLSNADGKLFLLSDQNLDVFEYHKENEEVTWETSTMRSWLNGYDASSNIGGDSGIDYTNDNFLDTAFSPSEQLVIADTIVINDDNPHYQTAGGNNTTDKVFLLSIAEATNTSYFADDNSRIATNTAYVAGGGKIGTRDMNSVGEADYWRLRSLGFDATYAANVNISGSVFVGGIIVDYCNHAVRPAFNLNLSSVLFTSAAKGGKSSTAAVGGEAEFFENVDISTLTGSDGYKLTLLDADRSEFAAEVLKISTKTFVSYSGATTGVNEYISAMICDAAGNVTYYGRLKNVAEASDASGYVEIDLSEKMNSGDKLYIFNEQYNGDYMTDYASELKEVTVPSENNAYEVSFNANSGTGTMDSAVVKPGETYTLPKCTLTPPADYGFLGWSLSADGEVITPPTITVTENITLYAKWATQYELIASLEDAVAELEEKIAAQIDPDELAAAIKEVTDLIDALDDTYATDTAVSEAITKAKDDITAAYTKAIEDAVADLEEKIAAQIDPTELAAEIKKVTDLIETAKSYADTQDTTLKSDLEEKIQNVTDRIAALENRTPMFKVENGDLYVRYNETDEWTLIGNVQGADGKDGKDGVDGKDGADGLTIAATVIGSTALASNIALIAYALIKKKRLF